MWNRTPLTKLLGIDYPIVQGPFGGQGSCVELAARVSSSGGLGSFGMHTLDGDQIRRAIRQIRARTSRPFAANLWMPKDEPWPSANLFLKHSLKPYYEELGLTLSCPPGRTIPDLTEQLNAVLEARPPVFSFIFGIPSERILALCRERGIITIGSAASAEEAVALERAGVDCVVISVCEAGPHAGHFMRPPDTSMTATSFALLPQLAACVHLPVIVSGGIGDARGVAAALALGAHGVQIGTAFRACDESAAGISYRERAVDESSLRTSVVRIRGGRMARTPSSRSADGFSGALASVPSHTAKAMTRRRNAGDLMNELVQGTPRVLERLLAADGVDEGTRAAP